MPWGKACNDDGTFKSLDELKALYGAEGVDRIEAGHRLLPHWRASSHTWFVLKYLLGDET